METSQIVHSFPGYMAALRDAISRKRTGEAIVIHFRDGEQEYAAYHPLTLSDISWSDRHRSYVEVTHIDNHYDPTGVHYEDYTDYELEEVFREDYNRDGETW